MFKKLSKNQGFAIIIPVIIMAAVALTAIGATVYVTKKPKASLSLGKASVTQGSGENRIVTIPFTLHFKSLSTANKSQYPYIRCSNQRGGVGESDDLPTDREEVTGAINITITDPEVRGTIRYFCYEVQTQASSEIDVDIRSLSIEPSPTSTPTETQKTEEQEPPESSSEVINQLQGTKWRYMINVGGGMGGVMTFENVSESDASGSYTEHGPLGAKTKRFTANFSGRNKFILSLPEFGQLNVAVDSSGKSMSGSLKDEGAIGGSNIFSATLEE